MCKTVYNIYQNSDDYVDCPGTNPSVQRRQLSDLIKERERDAGT